MRGATQFYAGRNAIPGTVPNVMQSRCAAAETAAPQLPQTPDTTGNSVSEASYLGFWGTALPPPPAMNTS